jgi:hypothetical protein
MSEPDLPAVQWLRQWTAAGPALAEIRKRELRDLTDEQALRASELVLSTPISDPLPPERRVSSGLVEQQARFHRHRPR